MAASGAATSRRPAGRYSAALVPGTRRLAEQQPPRQRSLVGRQHPALAGRRVDEIDRATPRAAHLRARADRVEIGERGAVAGQQQMVAVVDRHAERLVEIGAAAAAGLARGLVHHDVEGPAGERGRRGKPGEPGADHMDHRFAHQNTP